MSLKTASFQKIRSMSLTTKLMLLNVFSTICILMAIVFFLYPTFIALFAKLDSIQAYHLVAQCKKDVVIGLLLSAVAAAFLGRIVASRGLSRVRDFTARVKRICASSLSSRIDPKDWPSELKTLGREFNLMLDRLQGSFEQLSQFCSDISHELRTPLNNLRGRTELALTKKNLSADCRTLLEAHMEEYHYLTKLIENMLFLARSEQCQIPLDKQNFSAREETLKVMEYFQAAADERQVELFCKGDAPVKVDLILFKRLMNNLLSNALRYSDGGKINVEITTLGEKEVEIAVKDTGIGIEPQHLTKVFDRFYRIDSSRDAQSGGVGLGLAIVKCIMSLHHGRVDIKSQPRQGTAVHLFFPQ